MQFQAVLANAQHPEYGVVTIPFPIEQGNYDRTVELLKPLEIGDAVRRDCRIVEVCGDWPTLKQMEGTQANLDELDYLAKRLDSFDAYEKTQFQSMAFRLDLHGVDELINLTFCCQEATVVTDFKNLESLGRRHCLTMNGGSASVEEMRKQDFLKIAQDLLEGELGRITPYGVVYDNNFEMAQLYDGRHFTEYFYEDCVMEVEMYSSCSSADSPGTHLYLPITQMQQARAMARAEIDSYDDLRLRFAGSSLPEEVDVALDFENESLSDLNEMCRAIKPLTPVERCKLGAAVLLAQPKHASQVRHLAENLDQFDYVYGVQTPEELGKYVIMESGHFKCDENLMEFYDFEKYGRQCMEQENGIFSKDGYISYCGFVSMDEIMGGVPCERIDFQMGGME